MRGRVKSVFTYSSIIILSATFLVGTQRTTNSDFINFQLTDVKKDSLTEFIIKDKSILENAELTDKVLSTQEMYGTGQVKVSFKNPQSAEESIRKIAENGTRDIEADVPMQAFNTYSDPYYPSQTNLDQMGMPDGWDYYDNTSMVKIAVVDTGIRGTHEELSGKVSSGVNFLTDQVINAGTNSDDNGHGTAIASIAAASANGVGMVGVSYRSELIPVKVLNNKGSGWASSVASGVRWAVDHDADVINLSLGSSSYSALLHESLVYAKSKGVLVIAAAGNEGGLLSYPASDPLTFSVGSVSSTNVRSSYSNYGSELDVVAPGNSIRCADFSGDNQYTTESGTSISAAEVSGIAALASRWFVGSSVDQIYSYMREGTIKPAGMNGSDRTDYYGWGLSNYTELQQGVGSYSHQFLYETNSSVTLGRGESSSFTLKVKNTGSATWRKGVVNLGTSRGRDRVPGFLREGGSPTGWESAQRINLVEDSVAPGGTGTFTFYMKNPGLAPGVYREYFQLVADGIGWMEDYGIYWQITVPQPTAQYSHQFLYETNSSVTLGRGESSSFTLKVKNTGSATWRKGVVNLGTSREKDRVPGFLREGNGPSGWTGPSRITMVEDSVAPGQNGTFVFYMKNPGLSPGSYREYFQLVADGVTWMEDYGIYWEINAR